MNEDAKLDAVFTALAHTARRRMLGLVVGNGCSVTELAGEFDCSLNVVSKHVKVLEKAGLVQREQTGRVHQIRLEPKPLRKAAAFIERYEKIWERKLDKLSGHLDRMASQEAKSRTSSKRS